MIVYIKFFSVYTVYPCISCEYPSSWRVEGVAWELRLICTRLVTEILGECSN